ncbi:hypothetical protein Y032_0019g3807 [Ancylostoma ceylanicum]|nr:hypothetical protein Y032_0019g3807 [Ancylostoma ceylanicum]
MVSGRMSNVEAQTPAPQQTMLTQNDMDTWDRYWSIESSGTNEYTGPEKDEKRMLDEKILRRFKETVVKKPDGYYVRLPWKENFNTLPENKEMAIARLRSLLKQYPPEQLAEIGNTFREQLQQGIIEEIPRTNRLSTRGKTIHYLSYHVVYTPEKKTTPKRIVFDASAHPKGRPALNDVLHQGPLMLPNICGVLMRFRIGTIATIADIEKAFLQVRLHESDRDATRFLWVRDLTQPPSENNLVVYRFTRVTFGLNSSPFLLAATIHFHLESSPFNSTIAEQLKDNLYVDNLVMTAESREEAMKQYKETKEIFNSLEMNMREFTSSDETVRNHFDEKDRSSSLQVKVLGIGWKANTDTLTIKCTIRSVKKITKRNVLHINASIFDPLGWLTPLTIWSKVFFQSLWNKGYNWDQPLREEDAEQWKKLCDSIAGFQKELPRKLVKKYSEQNLFIFTDASTMATAACVYIGNNGVQQLLIAKTKLPSIKGAHTIPKLEMNALTIGARLARTTYTELKKIVTISNIYLFTDSEITLNWVKNKETAKEKGVLVSNRVKEIYNIAKALSDQGIRVKLGYVNTRENPADCATRGLSSEEFKHHFWWEGPEFIRLAENRWPLETKIFPLNDETVESLQVNLVSSITPSLEKCSSLTSAKRRMAWVLKFIHNTSRNLPSETKQRISKKVAKFGEPIEGAITATDMRNAQHVITLLHQSQYSEAITSATHRKLNLKQDEDGIWRCWGRLGKSFLPFGAKNPIFIAPNSHLAQLIILQAHGQLHRSTSNTIAEVRRKFWIPKLRQQVKMMLRKCVPCQRFNNLPFRYPPMSDLPTTRVVQARPFCHIGLDLFGPLKTKVAGERQRKTYGCIFTCMTTRMIHLELMKDASVGSFLNAIRRFIARRGVPKSITSDNAPTFILAGHIMKETPTDPDEEIQSFMAKTHIHWHTITPYAPWQGGFYERLIKDIKRSMQKALGKQSVDEDTLSTILTEVESCLNSRPLTYQEDDIRDIVPLRPIDFLQNHLTLTHEIATEGVDTQDPDYHTPAETAQIRTRFEAVSALKKSCEIVNKFWKAWNDSYLTSLREQHQKYLSQGRSTPLIPKLGQVILLQESLQPRNKWKLGRITAIPQTQEGAIRQVEVTLANKTVLKRPVNILVPLEIPDESQCITLSNPANLGSRNHSPQSSPEVRPLARQTDIESSRGNELNTPENAPLVEDMPENSPIRSRTRSGAPENSRYNFRRRPSQGYCPYNDNEYEVYTISCSQIQEKQICHFRMHTSEAATQFLQSLNGAVKALFEERELQRRLERIYDDITENIAYVQSAENNYNSVRQWLANNPHDSHLKRIHETISETVTSLNVTKQRMLADLHFGHILWEVYRLLIEAGAAKQSRRIRFEEKERSAERPNSHAVNTELLQREIEHIDQLLAEIQKLKVDYYVDTAPDNALLDKLTHMEHLLEARQSSCDHTTVNSRLDQVQEQLNAFMNSTQATLARIARQQQEDTEKLFQAQLRTLVQIKDIATQPQQDGITEWIYHEQTPATSETIESEPLNVANARRRLKELETVQDRSFSRRKTLLFRREDTILVCTFCCSVGDNDTETGLLEIDKLVANTSKEFSLIIST